MDERLRLMDVMRRRSLNPEGDAEEEEEGTLPTDKKGFSVITLAEGLHNRHSLGYVPDGPVVM
eukprot:gene1536-1934_t